MAETSIRDRAGDFASGVKEKAQDVAAGASTMVDKTKRTAQEWASAASETVGQTKEKVQEVAATVAETAENFSQEMAGMIRRYPLQSMLIVLGIGVLLGQFVRPSRAFGPEG